MAVKIGIIADTATDTDMGKVFAEKNGYEAICIPVKKTVPACMQFFKEPISSREAYITELIEEIKTEGGTAICVYANSVCAYVDFDKLSKENNIPIVTPFHAYKKISEQYGTPLVFAVTSGALAGIEESIWKSNPNSVVRGIYNLDIAIQIEAGANPEKIVKNSGLPELLSFAEKSGSDCLILGCTHFPYLKSEMEKHSQIPIIDPADTVAELLSAAIGV